MHKKMISAAANVYEVYKDGEYLNDVTLVDCCHMGRNMQSVYHTLKALGCTLKPKKELGDNGQGFIDECGGFYNRSEAFKIASKSGQPFNPEFILPTNRLDSSCIRHFPKDGRLKDWCDYNNISVEDSVSAILDNIPSPPVMPEGSECRRIIEDGKVPEETRTIRKNSRFK